MSRRTLEIVAAFALGLAFGLQAFAFGAGGRCPCTPPAEIAR